MLGIASPSCAVSKEPEIKELDKLEIIAARIQEITHYFDREIYYYNKYLENELKREIHLEL